MPGRDPTKNFYSWLTVWKTLFLTDRIVDM